MAENETLVDNQTERQPFFRPSWRNAALMAAMFLAFFGCFFLLAGWKFAVVITISITIHEAGHLWAMKHCGKELRGLYFLPGLGVAAVPSDGLGSREEEAFIAIMGPVWGTLAGIVAFALFVMTGIPEFLSAAWLCVLLNMFNMIPTPPLDGGRVIRSVLHGFSPRVSVWLSLVLLIGAVALIYQISWFFALLIGFFSWQEFKIYLRSVQIDEDYRRIVAKTEELGGQFEQMVKDVRTVVSADDPKTHEQLAAYERLDPTLELEYLLDQVALARKARFSPFPWGYHFVTDDDHFSTPYHLVSYLVQYQDASGMSVKRSLVYLGVTLLVIGVLVALMYFCSTALSFSDWLTPLLSMIG